MREQVIKLLAALGVVVPVTDTLLPFILQAVTDGLTNATNQATLPLGLTQVAVYNAAGQYLKMMKSTGQLPGIVLEGAIKQIKEGDTSITFAIGEGDMTPEQRLETLTNWLIGYGKDQIKGFRRVAW